MKTQAVSTNVNKFNELQNELVFCHGPLILNLFLVQTWYKEYFEKCGQSVGHKLRALIHLNEKTNKGQPLGPK